MYGLLDGVAGPPPTQSARAVLQALMASLGADGLRAAAAHPRLLASVDQHAAAIRDAIAPAGGPASLAALAGYAEGVHETAETHGWRPPAGPVDWSGTEGTGWVLVRLLAVCALARPLGIVPAPAVAAAPDLEGAAVPDPEVAAPGPEPERGTPPAG